ncbi:MAG: hypothetical protein L3J62_09710 [Gammaproteobacteria bacterium]|nr:hypothetical protein [Gammaproteobacteria bacterium]MCF6231040.1 hypothetical protein [Gammaproteobacteria bacterium]
MSRNRLYSAVLIGSALAVLTACGGAEVKPMVEEGKVKAKEAVQKAITPEVIEKAEVKVEEKVEELLQKAKPESKPAVKAEAVKVQAAVVDKVPEAVPAPKAVVKPTADAVKKSVANNVKLGARNPTKNRVASEKELKQKVSYARMMFMSKSSKRVAASNNEQAKAMLIDSKSKMERAKTLLEAGDLQAAQTNIDDSMRLFNAAAIMVPSAAVIAEQRKRYESLLKVLSANRLTHQENFDRMVKKSGKEAGIEYDVEQVDVLVEEAAKMAAEKDYDSAAATVDSANRMVIAATSEMLHDQTITYEINLDTPEGEWAYELDRYFGYEELIPVAIENKKPNKGQLFLINRNVNKGKGMAEKARKTADAGDYPRAIAMILDATKEIRKALRLMGVKQ